jgi:hypothetical protein
LYANASCAYVIVCKQIVLRRVNLPGCQERSDNGTPHIVVILICWLEFDEEGHCEHMTIRYSGLQQSVLAGQVADRPRNWISLHAAIIVAFVFPVAFSACVLSVETQSSRILAGRAVDNYYIININT